MKQLSILLLISCLSSITWGQCGKWNKPIILIFESGDTTNAWVKKDYNNVVKTGDCIKRKVKSVVRKFILDDEYFYYKKVGQNLRCLKLEEEGTASYYTQTGYNYGLMSSVPNGVTVGGIMNEYRQHYIEKNGKVTLLRLANYRRKLHQIFADCPVVQDDIKKCMYSWVYFRDIVIKYNQWLEKQK